MQFSIYDGSDFPQREENKGDSCIHTSLDVCSSCSSLWVCPALQAEEKKFGLWDSALAHHVEESRYLFMVIYTQTDLTKIHPQVIKYCSGKSKKHFLAKVIKFQQPQPTGQYCLLCRILNPVTEINKQHCKKSCLK